MIAKVWKAQKVLGEVPDLNITGTDVIPAMGLKEADATFRYDADELERALYHSLPGGTYDHLVSKMLARKASHLVVSHAGLEDRD